MAENNGKKFNGIQIGIPSLVLIFTVLCLVIFAVLSLLSVLSDNRFQERSRESIEGYYAADAAAEENLAEADAILIKCAGDARDDEHYRELIARELGDIYKPGTQTIEFAEKINENLILHVELMVYDMGSTKRYEITKWQEQNISDGEIDETLPVWTGED